MSPFFRHWLYIVTGILFIHVNSTAGIIINDKQIFNKPVNINQYISIYEDISGNLTINEIADNSFPFQPLTDFTPKLSESAFWLKLSIEVIANKHSNLNFSFRNFTYVELYEFRGDSLYKIHTSGLFRPKNLISQGDGPDNICIAINKCDYIEAYVKINHVKGYNPIFNFYLQDEVAFMKDNKTNDNKDFLIFGGFLFFFTLCLYQFFDYAI